MEQSIVVLKRDCTGPVARRQKTLAKCVIAYRVRYSELELDAQPAARASVAVRTMRSARLKRNRRANRKDIGLGESTPVEATIVPASTEHRSVEPMQEFKGLRCTTTSWIIGEGASRCWCCRDTETRAS
jgi:hypothetical protein